MPQRLLIIEDDQRLADMVATYLAQNDFEVEHAGTAAAGMQCLSAAGAGTGPDIVLLDLMLPDGSGLDLCRRIRALGNGAGAVPIVMLTAKGDTLDRIVGLELGADDYLAKPFEPRELLARLRAVLRRPRTAVTADAGVLRFGALEIDTSAHSLRLHGREVALTSHQFRLLLALAERAGRVLSREQLLDLIKGEALEPYDRSIDVHIGRLRAAIEADPKQPKRILTVRGVGYVFARHAEATADHG